MHPYTQGLRLKELAAVIARLAIEIFTYGSLER